MTDDPTTPTAAPTGGDGDLAKYRDMADRRKRQRDEHAAALSAANTRLAELESAERERKGALETAEQERARKAGEFESIEASLNAKIAELEAEREALTGEVGTYRTATQSEIDALLDGRDDADEIRKDLDGIPLERQLSIVKRTATAGPPQPIPGPGGQPRRPGGGIGGKPTLTPEEEAEAKSRGWTTPEQLERFAAQLAKTRAAREARQSGASGPTIITPKAG
jgi:hypothetical protein